MPTSNSSYRPAPWASATPTIYIQAINTDGSFGSIYVFDCFHTVDILSEAQKTNHPVQTGSGVTDHVFLLPKTITLDIGMSDAGVSFSPAMWSGGSASKSVQAYNVLDTLQQQRTLVNFTCKLGTFKNCIIERIAPRESHKTATGLRATVVLSQIFLVDITAQVVSARAANTTTTSNGNQNTTPVDPAVSANNTAPSTTLNGDPKNSYTNTQSSTQQSFLQSVMSKGSNLVREFFGTNEE